VVKPKVFLSHACPDDDFVRALDDRLSARGLHVINDERSFALGDSLVKDIFDKGLSQADACVLVLSEESTKRPWPREELDAAVVQAVERGMKLIPILLDDIPVPPPLTHRIYYKVGDRGSEAEIERVALSIELAVRNTEASEPQKGLVSAEVREAELTKRELLVLLQGHFENLRPLFFRRSVDVERWKEAHSRINDRAMKRDVNRALGAEYTGFMAAIRSEAKMIEIESGNQREYAARIVDKDGNELPGAKIARREYGAMFQQLLADTILTYVPWMRILGDPVMASEYEESAARWRELATRALTLY
jgi:TIR domain